MARKAKQRRKPAKPVLQRVAVQPSQGQKNGHNQLSLNGKQPLSKQVKKRDWAGFEKKTLWDLFSVFLIPLMIGLGTIGVTWQQSILSERQHESDLQIAQVNRQKDIQIADDQQKEAVLKTYLDDMTDLLINHNLLTSKPDDEVRVVARAKTLVALKKLDGNRKATIIQFLYEAHLIGFTYADAKGTTILVKDRIVHLDGADLSKVDLRGVGLSGADLRGVDLSGADLDEVELLEVNLTEVDLREAKLRWTYLDLANLSGADLRGADLDGVELVGANLTGARVTPEQLSEASVLAYTILEDGSTFPSQTWPIPGRDEKCAYLYNGKCSDKDWKETKATP